MAGGQATAAKLAEAPLSNDPEWIDNPLSAYSSHGTVPSAPEGIPTQPSGDVESLKKASPRPAAVSVMAVAMPLSAGISTVGMAVAEACDKDEA